MDTTDVIDTTEVIDAAGELDAAGALDMFPDAALGKLLMAGAYEFAELLTWEVASTYDFAEQLLTSQRKFAERVIEAAAPLFGVMKGPAARKGDTT